MNKISFLSDDTPLHLHRAILIYENSNHVANERGHVAVATVHDVQAGVIQPGQSISRESIEELSAALMEQELKARKPKGELSAFIPPELVALSPTMMAWHCPSVVRPIYFDTGNAKLDKLNGKNVCHPHLFFVTGVKGFKVFALASEERPGPTAKLYQAPYFNVWADHKVCLGGSKMPKALHPSLIHDYERGFFQSAFTHSNIAGTSLTSHKDGHLGLWQEMAKAKKFPAKYLKPLNITVNDVI